MKYLFRQAKPFRKECILSPVFKLLEASFELCVPLIMKKIIDVGIANKDQGYIIRMALLLVCFGVLGLVCTVVAQYFAAKASAGIAAGLKHSLFAHIQKLSFTELDTLGNSTMITRLTSDANQVQSGINLTLRLLLRSPFIVFGAAIMALTVDSKTALVFLAVIPLLTAVIFAVMLVCIPLYKKIQQKLDAVLGLTRENLTGTRIIRAFCREKQEIREFDQRCDELTDEQTFTGKIAALLNPMTYVLVNLAILALIYTGAIRVEAGIITQGAVVALYNYMSQILVELVKLANLIITMTKSVACEKRMESVLELTPSMKDSESGKLPEKGRNAVTFSHVSLTYHGSSAPALTDISFSAMPGETIGIIGGTGSGKSSLVNLIPRFYDATEGSVQVGGKDVKQLSLHDLRGRIGVVPQKAVLFRGTIRENLLWGDKNADDAAIREAVSASQSEDVISRKELGLEEPVEQNGRNLSGGQLQRLTIARALIRRPEILILDDSTSALDFSTDAKLRMALKKLSFHPTVFIVSQRTSSIMHADRIIVLDDGHAVGIGTHDELLNTCPVYREIYDSQFRKEDAVHEEKPCNA